MTRNWDRKPKQLSQIADLLGRSVESFSDTDESAQHLTALLDAWAELTDQDRAAVVLFAQNRAALRVD